jgi:hypothetical protein
VKRRSFLSIGAAAVLVPAQPTLLRADEVVH